MLNEAVALNPPEETEDRPASSCSKKSTALSVGSKIYKSKIPTTQFGRNPTQSGDSTPHPTYEESPNGISSNNNSARRSTMKTSGTPASNRKQPNTATEKRQLEIQYSTKKLRYANVKKALADKQKITQDLYDEMSSLREKIIAAGGKDPGKIEEPRSLQVECLKQSSPAPIETSSRHADYAESEQICMDESTVMGVPMLQNQLQDLCDFFQDLCQSAVNGSSSFASLFKSWLKESIRDETSDTAVPSNVEVEAQLAILERNNEELRTRLDELSVAQKNFVAEFTKRSSKLRSEYDNYRECVKERPNVDRKDLQKQLSVALEELRVERDKANQGKERTKMIELQMQKMRAKIRELEGHAANEEAKSHQLQNNIKSLEIQLKQKDQMMEQRLKDMHKAMKNSESLVAKMEKQRDTFESRIIELKEKMTYKETEANATIKDLSEKFETFDMEINEEREKRQQAENALNEIEERCKHLEEKSQLLCDLASEKSNNLIATDNGPHTENEICLYNDLKVARVELEKQHRKIEQLEKEKQEIVDVMHQAASHDNEDKTKDKLAAELAAKTNDFHNLTLEYDHLQKLAVIMQEKNEILQNKLSEIQHHFHARSKEDGQTGSDVIELYQQISDLRNSLAEVIRQNQELETTLTQKQLELEQRDRVMREQSKFLKVRDELLNLLKGKQEKNMDNSANESYEDIDEINKQIAAKTGAIQELYVTLESKQMQVMRLEKLVKLLEDQQDRAQAQRTRLEHRIAQLETSLQEKSKSNGRNRAFGIL